MSKIERLKLAKMLMKFGEIETDKGKLTYEGEIEVGLEVFIEVDNELVSAPDGEYKAEDGTVYVVAEGKINEIRVPESDEPVEEPKDVPADKPADTEMEDEIAPENEIDKDAKIADLEAKVNELGEIIKQRDEEIENLKKQLEEKDNELKMSAEKPAHSQFKSQVDNTIKSDKKTENVLKYFE